MNRSETSETARARAVSAFTLTELMIAVAVLAILVAMAIPFFSKSRYESQNGVFINDLRVAVAAFELYSVETGSYPNDGLPGQVPSGMSAYFGPKMKWTSKTSIGGNWDWDNGQFGFRAGVSVYVPNRTAQQMTAIDRIIDDGDLSTGTFRSRPAGYIWIIEN